MSSPLPTMSSGPDTRARIMAGVALAGLTMTTHLVNFGFTLAAARLLVEADFGTLTALLGMVLVGMAPGMAVQGLAAADVLTDQVTIDRGLARRLATIIAACVGVAVVVLGPAIGTTNPVVALAIGGAAGLLPLTGANEGRLQGNGRFTALGSVLLAGAATKFAVGVSGMAVTHALWAATVGVAAGYAVQRAVSHRLTGGLEPAGTADARVRSVVASGTIMMGLLLIVIHVDTVLATTILSDTEAGLYGGGATAARIVFWAPQFAVYLLYPHMVVDPRRRVVSLALAGLLAVAALGVGVASLVGPWFVSLAFPPSYAPIGPELWRFAWLGTAGIGLQVLALSDLASGRREVLAILATVLAGMVGLALWLRPPTPAAAVTLAASTMTAGVLVGWVRRMVHPSPAPRPADADADAGGP